MGSYLHGMCTEDAFRRAFLASLGATPGNASYDQSVEETLDSLADHLAMHVDCDRLLKQAEAKVEKLTFNADGQPKGTEPLDPAA